MVLARGRRGIADEEGCQIVDGPRPYRRSSPIHTAKHPFRRRVSGEFWRFPGVV